MKPSTEASATAVAESTGEGSNSSHQLSLPQLSKKDSSERNDANGAEDDPVAQESQLSQDLALFLANPSLKAALADGSLDLASYSSTVEQELHELETQCIAVYRSKQKEIESLKAELGDCSTVLAALHEMLLGFQADLGGLSGEIRQLQQRSRTLDVQLRNRRAAEEKLRHFLEKIVVAPSLANTLLTGPVNPVFLQAVQELNAIYKNAVQTQPQEWSGETAPSETESGKEMVAEIEILRTLTVTRVRDYFLQQMALLRRPQTNIRIIQVHGLLKYAALQDFLQEASPDVIAAEIFNVYCDSMKVTLQQLFRTYSQQLLQLDSTKINATRADVIAIDDALLRDTLTTRAKKRVDVFCLGNRAEECLQGLESSSDQQNQHRQPIMAHVALSEHQRYPYERLFRSLLGHLVDAVTNEHVFCRQFFKRDAFPQLFTGTLTLLLEQLENYLFGCYDALCLLLMIKVTHSYRRLARNRKIHSLDPFLDQITHLLWPRLKTVMEAHMRSIKSATVQKLGNIDLHAHYVSRRFGEFCCSILLILHSTQHGSSKPAAARTSRKTVAESPSKQKATPSMSTDVSKRSSFLKMPSEEGSAMQASLTAGDKLLEDLSDMIDEFLVLLERLSEKHSSQKNRTVFMINNLDHIVCIFQERRVVGKELNKFVELLMHQRELFVEEELLTGFSKMIAFIQQTEAHIASSAPPYDVNASVVESLVLDFASNWKSNIEQINRNVLSYFSNFRNGMEILKQCLTQLLLYYTRFQDIIRKVWRNKPPALCKDLVSTTVILAEIKKYALAI